MTKANAAEKVGVVAKKNGLYYIVEYSEMSAEHSSALLSDGVTLRYRHGSILVFMFEAKFLVELAVNSESSSLYHKAFKKIQYCDLHTMELVTPEKENAWKFELFIQNFLPLVEVNKLGVLEVERETEFAPIKNADSEDHVMVDSPASSRILMLQEHTNWLLKAGVALGPDAINKVEVSSLYSYEGEGIDKAHVGTSIEKAGYINGVGKFEAKL